MVTADLWPNLPENPTWIFVVCLGIVVGYLLLRAYTANQQIQIEGLRQSLESQEKRHADQMSEQEDRHQRQMAELHEKLTRLDAAQEDARSERHRLRGDYGKALLTLDIVRSLQAKCGCGALEPLGAILDSFFADRDT